MSEEKTINEKELEKVSGGNCYDYDNNDFNEKWTAYTTTHCSQCDQENGYTVNGRVKCDPGHEQAKAAYAAGQEVKCPNYTPLA